MNLPSTPFKPKGLTPSQKRNLGALIMGGLVTLNEHWPQVVALVGQHYHGLPVPPAVTLALQLAALGVTSLSRALSRAKSGTGTGLVGEPPATPAPSSEGCGLSLPAPIPSAPQSLIPQSLIDAIAKPALPPALDELTTRMFARLPAADAQAVKAFVAGKVAALENEAALNMTQQLAKEFLAAPPPPQAAPAQAIVPQAIVPQGGAVIVAPMVDAISQNGGNQ